MNQAIEQSLNNDILEEFFTSEELQKIDGRYKLKMQLWGSVVVGWILLTLALQAAEISKLSMERTYLRERLFTEMNLSKDAQEVIALQASIHQLFELEVSLLRRQVEMTRVENYIVKETRQKTSRETAQRIVQAVYSCSDSVDMDPLFAISVMEQESHFNPMAVSNKNARGLMQLMPATAKSLGISMAQIHNVEKNVCGGVIYLARHLKAYNGSRKLALQRYYGGGEYSEYAHPVLVRYAKIQHKIRSQIPTVNPQLRVVDPVTVRVKSDPSVSADSKLNDIF